MEISLVQGLFFPLLILLVEYFLIQPWLRYREASRIASNRTDANDGNRHRWSDGIKNAIKQFKHNYSNYNWNGFSYKQHFVEISNFSISKGQAEILLKVNVRYLLDKQRQVGEYLLITDRIGDISQLETISIRKNPFDKQDIPLPGSWAVFAIIALAFVFFRFLSSAIPEDPNIQGTINNIPISQLWKQANPISFTSPLNGTIGENEIDVYSFSVNNISKVKIEVAPIDSFECFLSIYNQNNAQIRRIYIGKAKGSIEIAPELNVTYMIIIEPYWDRGGSYVINIQQLP